MDFVQERRGDIFLFTIPGFSSTGLVQHGFTARQGGFSRGAYQSLNLAFHVGDDPNLVRKNREKVLNLLDSSLTQLVASEQVHGRKVHIVRKEDMGRGSITLDTAIPGVDGLMTNVPGIMLSSYYADCVPLFFLDPIKKVIALAHAGWKGTLQKIADITLNRMKQEFSSDPASCLAAIGPAIGPCCFRVDRAVLEKFVQSFDDLDHFCFPEDEEKWFIDLPGLNEQQLIRSGILEEHITRSRLCTGCNNNTFFSYRKQNGQTGRQASFIMLKEGEQ